MQEFAAPQSKLTNLTALTLNVFVVTVWETELCRYFSVKEQASWVCQCDDQMVQRLEQDFKSTLQEQNSLEQWAAWLEGVVTEVLEPHENSPNFAKAARQFLLKWSFYR